jgi:hypothetical protein
MGGRFHFGNRGRFGSEWVAAFTSETVAGLARNGWPICVGICNQHLIDAIDQELAGVPIEQQTVVIAVLWDIDTWGVDVLTAPPTGSRYDGWADCLIDFDQYVGSTESIRQGVAEALADDLMNQTFPGWQDPHYGEPEPDWEEDWH